MNALLREEASIWLQRYFFPLDRVEDLNDGAARVALIAGINNRYDPVSPIKFSESGNRVSARYIDAFQKGIALAPKLSKRLASLLWGVFPGRSNWADAINYTGRARLAGDSMLLISPTQPHDRQFAP
jgi:hypothetical protein